MRQKTTANAPGPVAPGEGGHIDSRPAAKRQPTSLRRYRLRSYIGRIYARNPALRDTAPEAVLDLADITYQLGRIFTALEAATDERTQQRLWGLQARLLQMASTLRQRLGLDADDEEDDLDGDDPLDREGKERYRRHFGGDAK